MRLLVLAGGFGIRLKKVVAEVPKALAPVGGVPFLQLQLEQWLAQGLCEFTFLLHHQANHIPGLRPGCNENNSPGLFDVLWVLFSAGRWVGLTGAATTARGTTGYVAPGDIFFVPDGGKHG